MRWRRNALRSLQRARRDVRPGTAVHAGHDRRERSAPLSWDRKLSEPLKPSRGRELRTLHDVFRFVKRIGLYRDRQHWRKAMELMLDAAEQDGDIEACTRQIRFAMFMDGLLFMASPSTRKT